MLQCGPSSWGDGLPCFGMAPQARALDSHTMYRKERAFMDQIACKGVKWWIKRCGKLTSLRQQISYMGIDVVGHGSTPTIFPPIEPQQQHHLTKVAHDAHLPTKNSESTPLLRKGDGHTYRVVYAS